MESRLPNILPSCACTMLVILTQNPTLHKYNGVNFLLLNLMLSMHTLIENAMFKASKSSYYAWI
jgi:hypothetical protein